MEYALYKGDELLAMGTVREIAAATNVKVDTVMYYKTPTYKRRLAKRRTKNAKELVPLDD